MPASNVIVIDNYDSFTYNLVQYLLELGATVKVVRNDELTVQELESLQPSHLLISPGPGHPKDAGICPEVIQKLYTRFPILGVCLGHQAIGMVFNATITHAPTLMHGKTSPVLHDNKTIFNSIPSPFQATRYHSLVIKPDTLPKEFEQSAQTPDGVIMGIRHKQYPLEGVQFHPESILTEHGKTLLDNFLKIQA